MNIYIVEFSRDYYPTHARYTFSTLEKAKAYAYKHGYSERENGCYIGSGEEIGIYESSLDDEMTEGKHIPPNGGVT